MTSSPAENDTEDAKDQQNSGRSSRSDFSIEHILNRAGNSSSAGGNRATPTEENPGPFPWLHCTRYCPPKILRHQKRDGPQKRQLGRHPRIPFTSQQLAVLEEKFRQTPYLSSAEVSKISRSLQLADIRVKIWFQNRRARERRERLMVHADSEQQPLPEISNEQDGLQNGSSPSCSSPIMRNLEGGCASLKTSTPLLPVFPLLHNYTLNYDSITNVSPYVLNFTKSLRDSNDSD